MMRYNGVSVQEMINYLSKVDEAFKLERLAPYEFRCYARGGELHGEYENTGSLFYVVMHAFKPYCEQYENEAEAKRAAFSQVFPDVTKPFIQSPDGQAMQLMTYMIFDEEFQEIMGYRESRILADRAAEHFNDSGMYQCKVIPLYAQAGSFEVVTEEQK
jgi:hypothetical protein